MNKRMFGVMVFFLIASLGLVGCGLPSEPSFPFDELEEPTSEPLVIGQVPSMAIVEMLHQREPFIRALEEYLDRTVYYRFAQDYDGFVQGMREGEFDIAIPGPYAYVEAVDRYNVSYRPLVKPQRFGSTTYKAIIFTHRATGISSLREASDRSFAFVDRDSTSGYLFPRAHMLENYGFDPIRTGASHEFLGSHDEVVQAVLQGRFDVGSVYQDARQGIAENPDSILPVLDTTRPILSEPVVIREGYQQERPEEVQKLKTFFLTLHESERGDELLSALGDNIERFHPAKDSDYDDVRRVFELLQKSGRTAQ